MREPQILILGGGQLARMMLPPAARLDLSVTFLDPSPDCPVAAVGGRSVTADFADTEAVVTAGKGFDLVSIEIEHVSTEALAQLEDFGVTVRPGAETVATINDKLAQRRALEAAGLPQPRFAEVDDGSSPAAIVAPPRLPAIQKLRFGGYDGRGVAQVSPQARAYPLTGPSLLEELVDIDRELAVLVARRPGGESVAYEPFEMEMDPELHLVDAVVYPAAISEEVATEAKRVALAAVAAVSGVGVLAVELFLDRTGRILVNEIAPRPHNSGHLTIEAAETDQFEQHLRAILDLPLGSTRMRCAAVMRNILGQGAAGPVVYSGREAALSVDGAHLHLYGKRMSRPGRKMGHLTVTGTDVESCRRGSEAALNGFRVEGRRS